MESLFLEAQVKNKAPNEARSTKLRTKYQTKNTKYQRKNTKYETKSKVQYIKGEKHETRNHEAQRNKMRGWLRKSRYVDISSLGRWDASVYQEVHT